MSSLPVKGKVLHIPTVLGAVCADLQHPRRQRRAQVHARRAGRHFPGQDQEVERSPPGQGQSRRQVSGRRTSSSSTAPTAAAPPTFGPTTSPRSARSGRTRSVKGTSVKWPAASAAKATRASPAQSGRPPAHRLRGTDLRRFQQDVLRQRAEPRREFRQSQPGICNGCCGSVKDMPADFRVSITNAPGKDAYPISSFTWLLIPAEWADTGKEKASWTS